MPQNFLTCDREQVLLMPPSLREWLPEGHFAWFVLAAVEELDLSAFYAAYRQDGHGRAAHDPAVMVALLLYDPETGPPLCAIRERDHQTRHTCSSSLSGSQRDAAKASAFAWTPSPSVGDSVE